MLTTVSKLRLSKDEEEDVDKGFVHELSPEILTKRQTVLVAAERKDKIAEGMEFSDYLLNSTEHKLVKTVHIYSIVTQAVTKFTALLKTDLKIAEKRKVSFSIFPAEKSANAVIDRVKRLDCKIGMPSVILIDKDSKIVMAFNKAEVNIEGIDLI